MPTARNVREVQADLHAFAADLARLDSSAAPKAPRRRAIYLDRRTNHLEALVETTEALQDAHTRAGNPLGAAALAEHVEHYVYLLALARRDVQLHQPHAIEAVRTKNSTDRNGSSR
ncbi:hypothetical protein [Streptomyces sp. NPDC059009]|uniref:hypothetical protein n=1 Tax=Streptomyces sp. NPDC059009 TaxID=3346694 RepID=UPI0036C074A3